MTTLLLQLLRALLVLWFAWTAHRVARAPGGMPEPHRAAWTLVAVSFTWVAAIGLLQGLAAVWAYFAGPGSEPYTLFLRWNPAGNHGRSLIGIAAACALALLPRLRGRPERLRRVAPTAGGVLAAVGIYTASLDGGTTASHLTTMALLTSVELLLLLGALLAGMLTGTLDRLLWVALAVYAFHAALNVVWTSALTGYFKPGGWYPPPHTMYYHAVAAFLGMGVLAARRLSMARHHVPVPALLEPVERTGVSVFG